MLLAVVALAYLLVGHLVATFTEDESTDLDWLVHILVLWLWPLFLAVSLLWYVLYWLLHGLKTLRG